MPRLFTLASWNVEHFRNRNARVERVVEFIQGQHGGPAAVPEVFAIYEVEGREVYDAFMDAFPNHHFHLTEGKQTQEIFVGVHNSLQSFTTQRLEYKTGREALRPGLFLTVRSGLYDFNLLFLHVKSGDGTEDGGLRDAAFTHAFNLKRALDDLADPDAANYLFLGDLNTMGVDDPFPYDTSRDLDAADEIARLDRYAQRRDMLLATKDEPNTWWGAGGIAPSNLDHVVVSDHLDLRMPGGGQGVTVLGWPKLGTDAQRRAWIRDFSDHGMLVAEMWV